MTRQPTQIQTPETGAETDSKEWNTKKTASQSREEKLQAALNEVAEVVASNRRPPVKLAQLAMTLSGCEDEGLIAESF